MAKSKSFFGLRRGSTKSLTFSVLNGQQVTKDRVYGGKNPRTLAQMNQRMAMATASAAYAAMKQIVDHSFEGISYGANTMARFLSLNTKLIKADMSAAEPVFAYNPFGDRELKPGAYVMSKGSLSPIAITPTVTVASGGASASIAFAAGASATTADALNAALGLNVGGMATVCFIYALANSTDCAFAFLRIKAKAAGTTALTAENFGTYYDIEGSGAAAISTVSTGTYTFTLGISGGDNAIGVVSCTIHSEQSNGEWKRSNATMAIPADYELAPAYADAIATYPVGESYVLNGGDID